MVKKGKRTRRGRRGGIDHVVFPLMYAFNAGSGGATTVQSLYETFDRSRAFRIARIWGSFCAIKYPVIVQWRVMGPQSGSDNIWCSPLVMVPSNGPKARFNYRIPLVGSGWYPSGTAVTTELMEVWGMCIDANYVGRVEGFCNVLIQMRPYEPSHTCPNVMMPLREMSHMCASTSAAPRSIETSPSVSIIDESDEEYFSCEESL